jgi:hypothetical protein
MCLFTGEVEKVSDTSIFARGLDDRQLLVYAMTYAAEHALAMVLPIPVFPGAGEDAVRFVSLEECPDFFGDLRRGFPSVSAQLSARATDVDAPVRTLTVHSVGAFEASFVPQPEDFGRLDERFRLPAELWLELKHYHDWGFAVFKLRESALSKVHPMAFDFPRRDRSRLFFPTLHLHHGRLERSAAFDHTLYCQAEPADNFHLGAWEDSREPAKEFVLCAAGQHLLDLEEPCWRVSIEGECENRDTWVGRGETIPPHLNQAWT